MGHRSKFTFPLPGRKPKPSGFQTISAPLSKVQLILGSGDINIDSVSSKDPSGPWETMSNSGMSISISESSASYTTETGLGILEGQEGTAGTSYGGDQWEQESDIIPSQLRSANGVIRVNGVPVEAEDYESDGDSMASNGADWRQSRSTIFAHYEKTKVPLSISQQTSNSAMAKGLPRKASSLLDMDGTISASRRKKPSKLDLSLLMPRTLKEYKTPSQLNFVLGNGYVMKSPSVMSTTSVAPSGTAFSNRSQRTLHKVIAKPSRMETLTPSSMMDRIDEVGDTKDGNGLRQLYDHYEQMSLRNAPDPEEEVEEEIYRPPNAYEPSPPASEYGSAKTNPFHDPEKQVDPDSSDSDNTMTSTSRSVPLVASAHTAGGKSRHPTSARQRPRAGKSSRATGSRAAKTKPEIDYKQTSVLDLSDSDSGEETSTATALRPAQTRRDLSTKPSTGSLNGDAQARPPLKPPVITERVSSKNQHTVTRPFQQLSKIPGSKSEKEDSLQVPGNTPMAAKSTLAPGQASEEEDRPATALGLQQTEPAAAAEAIATAKEVSSALRQSGQFGRQRAVSDQVLFSRNSRNANQLTPPISPSTLTSFTQNANEQSMTEPSAIPASPVSPGKDDSRIMAVTKQEEMLLAALRRKRAKMRANATADSPMGRSDSRGSAWSAESTSTMGSDHTVTSLQSTSPADSQGNTAGSDGAPTEPTSTSLSTPKAGHTGGFLSPRSATSRQQASPKGKRTVTPTASDRVNQLLKNSVPVRATSPSPYPTALGVATSKRSATSLSEEKTHHERVLLCLDRPLGGMKAVDVAEPSPDLSDFVSDEEDYDTATAESNRRLAQLRSKLGSIYGNSYNYLNDEDNTVDLPRVDSSPLSPESFTMAECANNEPAASFGSTKGEATQKRAPSVDSEGIPRPDSLVSTIMELPDFSKGHRRGKKSTARLSAVGRAPSPSSFA